MQVGAVGHALDNLMGLALYQMLAPGPSSASHAGHTSQCQRPFHVESKGLDAAFRAFESYIAVMDTEHQAMIAGAAIYALQPHGKGAAGISAAEMAPFLALNLLA